MRPITQGSEAIRIKIPDNQRKNKGVLTEFTGRIRWGKRDEAFRKRASAENYARSRRFLAGAKIESSANSAATLRLRPNSPRPPKMVSMAAPLPKPTMAPFKNPLLETPSAPSDRFAMSLHRSIRVLPHIIEHTAPYLEGRPLKPSPHALYLSPQNKIPFVGKRRSR